MKKRYKVIFGNPPYSIDENNNGGGPKNLWIRFSQSSLENADEVYYITPYIWSGRNKRMISDDKVCKVDLDIVKEFEIFSSICYWNTHKKEKKEIFVNNRKIEVDKLSEIKYIPYDAENTLSIHRKGWDKNSGLLQRNSKLDTYHYKSFTKNIYDDREYKYKAFHYSINNLFYTNEKGISKYGKKLFYSPKVIIGTSSDNSIYFDRVGEYATTHVSYYIVDTIENLEIRIKQLESNFSKFWFQTGRQLFGNTPAPLLYHATFKLFPDIPLNITTDADITAWLGLTDEEVSVVEKYAAIATDSENKRRMRYEKKV